MDFDALLGELTELRKGPGVTLRRLKKCPAVLEALGESDLTAARSALVEVIYEMGTGLVAEALKNALAIGVEDPQNLTRRRNDFAVLHEKHADTVEAYENQGIEELAVLLGADRFSGDVFVSAHVSGRHIDSIVFSKITLADDDGPAQVRSHSTLVNESSDVSLPCLIYRLPPRLRPASVVLWVEFQAEPYPTIGWAVMGTNTFDVVTGRYRSELALNDNKLVISYEIPQAHLYYAVIWDY